MGTATVVPTVHIPKDPLKNDDAPRPSIGRRGLDLHMIDPGSTHPMSRPTPVAAATVWEPPAQPELRRRRTSSDPSYTRTTTTT
eukprot:gene10879-biopygen9606